MLAASDDRRGPRPTERLHAGLAVKIVRCGSCIPSEAEICRTRLLLGIALDANVILQDVLGEAHDFLRFIVLQQLDGIDASALLESKKVGIVAGSVESVLTRLENVTDGFE